MKDDEALKREFYGRMYECCDIEMAIESGQFQSLDDVLSAVKARSAFISSELKKNGFTPGVRSISREDFDMVVAQYESNISLKH